ncbi:MAG: immunoglobulin domain-containing protein, partial [Limisphaerales bacterium]
VALAVFAPPAITTHPASRTVSQGNSLNLNVAATGTAPLSYQWYLNSVAISDATNSTYSILNAQSINGGNYFAVVANAAGAATSSVARVQVALQQTPFAPANLVVLRLGDGAQTLANTGNSIFLDQFTSEGAYVSTMGIPDSGSTPVIIGGTATSEGALVRSANRLYLTFAAYDTNRPAPSNLSASTSATVPRAVAQVSATGSFGVMAKTSTQFSGSNVRSAVSDGANNFWGAGGNSGTYYYGNESSAATVQGSVANTRVISIFNGNLYFSTGSGTRGIYRIEGMPNTNAPAQLLIPTGTSSNPYAFAVNENETIVYIADDNNSSSEGGIQRWDKVEGVWVRSYIFGTGSTVGARGLVVDFSGLHPVIYATSAETSANRLIRIVDSGVSSTPVTLATAGASQVFRGVSFGPEAPQPVQIVADPLTLDRIQGEAALFSVTANGTAPLSYQWLKNGSTIPGATNQTFEIPAVHPADAADYSVIVSNLLGPVQSAIASLTVTGDGIAPVLKVLEPKNNIVVNNQLLALSGTVLDNLRLANVGITLNDANPVNAALHFVTAGKPTNWNATLQLKPGTNDITITARDTAGNSTSPRVLPRGQPAHHPD